MTHQIEEWQTPEHALRYLSKCAGAIPHRTEGEGVLLELLAPSVERVLDLGTGDGRLVGLVRLRLPDATIVATDFSPPMLDLARDRFASDQKITVVEHDFRGSILELGTFDAVVSCFAIHHLEDERKEELYREVFAVLAPGGIFANLEHVASATENLHDEFLAYVGMTRQTEDQSNRCRPVELQLEWLRKAGFEDVDCHWKWRELGLLAGVKPR
jgi:tRNA (cmo5U34)-methyltransferase